MEDLADKLSAEEIRLKFPDKLVTRWLEAGYRAWVKRQKPRKSRSKAIHINEKLRRLSKVDLKSLILKITK